MEISTYVTGIFYCSLERAFKSPILGDATRFLDGYLFQPPVIRFENDSTWGNVDGYRYPVLKGNVFMKSSRIFTDRILERRENDYWKWKVYDFTTNSLFFAAEGIGEWFIINNSGNEIMVKYKYTFSSKNIFLHPINWLFVKVQLKGMMNKALKGIQKQAESQEVLYYERKSN